MTYEDMLDKIKANGIYVQGYGYKTKSGKNHGQMLISGDEYIEVSWVAGGMTGGNCWGGTADSVRIPEPPEELRELDKILEILVPDITYLQFKKIDEKIDMGIKSGEHEYYGNYTKYAYKSLKLKDLYDVLVEMSLI